MTLAELCDRVAGAVAVAQNVPFVGSKQRHIADVLIELGVFGDVYQQALTATTDYMDGPDWAPPLVSPYPQGGTP